jgi:hypothetical protein
MSKSKESKVNVRIKSSLRITKKNFAQMLLIFSLAFTNAASAEQVKPPVTHQFLANTYTAEAADRPGSITYQASVVEQVTISESGTLSAKDFSADANARNILIASGKNGFIVQTFWESNGKFRLNSYLNDGAAFKRIGIKTNYVEPGTLDNKNQYVYGRQVRDGVNSTRIVRQSVKTGALSYHFDANSNGGGFVCGIATDSDYRRAYFTHLQPDRTILYKVNLSNGKFSKVRNLSPGFCIDTVIDDTRLAGTLIEVRNQRWDSSRIAFVDLSVGTGVTTLDLPFELKWISEHQMVRAGDYLYLNFPFASGMEPAHLYIDLTRELGDPNSIIEVLAQDSLFGRFTSVNYLPINFRS